jgi:hypothetical protein
MQNKEQKAGTTDEQRNAADSLPCASLAQNGMLAEAKFKPILFSTDMVTAILEGRKTMTRRKLKPKDEPYLINEKSFINYSDSFGWNVKHKITDNPGKFEITQQFKCPYGKIGDVLWVRETWLNNSGYLPTDLGYVYKAELGEKEIEYSKELNVKWKPSIFMPKEACRIFLEITNVKVERLQDISEDDAIKEGITWNRGTIQSGYGVGNSTSHIKAKECFQSLWKKINGAESWKSNPFVWVVTFKQIERPEGFC